MKHCAVGKRMKAACAVIKPQKLSSELSNLEAEMDEIAKLLVKCCNDYIVNGDSEGLKYMSEIDAVKSFLPEPESYRNLIEKNCSGSFNDPTNPRFYEFEIIKVVEGIVTFKSLFSLEAADESVEKFVVLQVGQRAALILVRLARIASMQSRFYTALACCRVGLILVRFLFNISCPVLWTSQKILVFLLAAEAVESCTFLVAFDHHFFCHCAEIMEKAVLEYHDFLNIFRSYGDGLTISEADLMLSDGESLAEIRTIVEKLSYQLVDWSAGMDLLFNLSMFYFHLARKDVAALKSALLSTVPPRDENVEFCVRGFLSHPDSYMMGAALFCRGCFHSASGHKGLNQERTALLMSAESDFLNVLNVAKTSQIPVSSIPWLRLMEKASLASLVTRCRILVRSSSTFDVHHLRNSLDYLYSLVSAPSSPRLEDRIFSTQNVSAVASLAFVYMTDHTPGAPDLFDGPEKASVSRRRAECESLASQLMQDEATLSFCLKVFCDLTQELLGGEEVLSNGETQLHRCLYRLQLLSMPIFAAITRSGSLFKRAGPSNANATFSADSENLETSASFQGNPAECFCNSDCKSSNSSECGDNASRSTSSGVLECHKISLQLPHIAEATKNSRNILIDNRRISSDEFVDKIRTKVDAEMDIFKFRKMKIQALNDELKTSTKLLCLEEENITANNNLSLTVDHASLNAQADSLLKETIMLDSKNTKLQSQSPTDQIVRDESCRSGQSPLNYNPLSSNQEVSVFDKAFSDGNLDYWSEKPIYDSVLNPRSHFNFRIQSIDSFVNNTIELKVANAPSSEQYHDLADKDTIHSKPKQVEESSKINLEALTNLNISPSSIVNTPKLSVRMESFNAVPPVVSQALEDFVTAMLDRGFDILNRRTVSRNIKSVCQKSAPSNEEWVAVFPPNNALPVGAGLTNLKSEAVTTLELENSFCGTQLSRVIKEAAFVLERSLMAQTHGDLVPRLKEHPSSQNAIQCGQDEGVELKWRSLSCKLTDDSESWLLFLRRSSLLTTVEDSLDDLFVLDGTDDLLILKNTIAKDLQNLCLATIGKRGALSNNNPAYLSVFAHCAYTNALQHLHRSSNVADFHSLLTTLFDTLDENPLGSAARWT